VVERCVPSRIDDNGSWWHDTAKARRRMRVVLHAQKEEASSAAVASMASLMRGFALV
jgi:hypothetical protein